MESLLNGMSAVLVLGILLIGWAITGERLKIKDVELHGNLVGWPRAGIAILGLFAVAVSLFVLIRPSLASQKESSQPLATPTPTIITRIVKVAASPKVVYVPQVRTVTVATTPQIGLSTIPIDRETPDPNIPVVSAAGTRFMLGERTYNFSAIRYDNELWIVVLRPSGALDGGLLDFLDDINVELRADKENHKFVMTQSAIGASSQELCRLPYNEVDAEALLSERGKADVVPLTPLLKCLNLQSAQWRPDKMAFVIGA